MNSVNEIKKKKYTLPVAKQWICPEKTFGWKLKQSQRSSQGEAQRGD